MTQDLICPKGHTFSNKEGNCPICKNDDPLDSTIDLKSELEMLNTQFPDDIIPVVASSAGKNKVEEFLVTGDATVIFSDENQPIILGWLVLISEQLGLEYLYKDYPLYQGRNLIGTLEMCQVLLPFPNDVDSVHGLIRCSKNGEYTYTDCHSQQGSYLNSSLVQQSKLYDGNIIRIGKLDFMFHSAPTTVRLIS